MENIIQTENLGKKYVITHEAKGAHSYTALRDVLTDGVKNLWKKASGDPGNRPSTEEIWALRNISLEIKQGERLGVIGRNGSGKSTFLKLLSRITEPTEGSAKIKGRVSSLLEVGTGFHPELTGRENVYLNGAVLGMKKAEIDFKFDEMVAFSGCERFLDTPVKRYSSGMQVRLAFAVAAHLEPEILLIDEVLAVGDAEFRQKCLGKMDQVSKQHGRTILFVSHNMAAIHSLCTRAVFLDRGRIAAEGNVDEIVQVYLDTVRQKAAGCSLLERDDRTGGETFRFSGVEFVNAKDNSPVSVILSGQEIIIRIYYNLKGVKSLSDVTAGIHFYTEDGRFLFECFSYVSGKSYDLEHESGHIDCRIPKWPLTEGRYSYTLDAGRENRVIDRVEEAGFFDCENGDYFSTGKILTTYQGVLVPHDWL